MAVTSVGSDGAKIRKKGQANLASKTIVYVLLLTTENRVKLVTSTVFYPANAAFKS